MSKKVFLYAVAAVMLSSSMNAQAAGLQDSENKYQDIKTVLSANVKSAAETIENNFRYALLTVQPQEEIIAAEEESVEVASAAANEPETTANEPEAAGEELSGRAVVNTPVEVAPDNKSKLLFSKLELNNAILTSMSSTYVDPTMMTKSQREAAKTANKYASADWSMTAEPVNNQYDSRTLWVRPYASFESVETKSTSDVSNVGYGIYFGGDSQIIELGNGWEHVFGLHAGYNGSHQAWKGNSAYQNGGTLGYTGTFYKGNFFDTITFGAGANAGKGELLRRNNKYSEDDFGLFHTGVANKVGYNFEKADGKLVIQPSFLTSYTYAYTYKSNLPNFSSTNQHLHSIGLEPGLKIMGNLENGWQPYASISVVWNLMTKRYNFRPYEVALSELAAKPYVRYGVGLKKSWNDDVCGFVQTYVTSGGREGVGLQAGFRWTVGK